MSIRTVFLLIFFLLTSLLGSLVYVSYLLAQNQQRVADCEVRRFESYKLADELRQSSDDLTRFARTYVVTGDSFYEQCFRDVLAIRNGQAPRPAGYDRIYWDLVTVNGQDKLPTGEAVSLRHLMHAMDFTAEEMAKLNESQARSDALVRLEEKAMNAVKGLFEDASGAFTIKREPDPAMARAIMHGTEYHQAKASIMEPINEFLAILDERTATQVHDARQKGHFYAGLILGLAGMGLALTFGAFLVLHRRVILPVRKLVAAAEHVEQGRYEGRVDHVSTDELGELARTFNHMAGAIEADIKTRAENQAELAQAKVAADSANQAKSDFLANMSHEIRTPMNGIIGMTELTLDTDLTPEQREYLNTVRSSAEALLTLINDILDFSKIEAGKLELEPIDFALRDALADMLNTLAVRAHHKGLELLYDVPPEVHDALVGDVYRVRQVIVNLVGNAIKFTAAGEIVVGVTQVDRSVEHTTLQFSVRDTGVGIPQNRLAAIFEPFEQADASTTRQFGGTGLGLAISVQLVELMQGRIWAESEPGEGSTFHFTARFGLGTAVPVPDEKERKDLFDSLPVLVVDDNATNRRILEQMLRNWSMVPHSVEGGEEAMAALDRAASAGQPFKLVLSDVNMPDVDGFMLYEKTRSHPRHRGIPFILLTSGARLGDVARSREIGVAAHMTKPVKQSILMNSIASAVAGKATLSVDNQQDAKAPPPTPARVLQVLLAEDNAVNQKFAVRAIEKAGHTVAVANNGREAVEAWQKNRYDVVLMDVQMPEMDGLQATASIRGLERERGTSQRTPIIAMTANAMKGDKERCLEAGMDGYVSKPVKRQILFEEIDRVLGTD